MASRMALVSNREAMSSLMPLRNCLTLLKTKLPWFRIMRAIFYILLVISNTKLGEFMLRNLILFLTMLLCIRMRLLALGILLMLNKSGKIVAKYVGGKHKGSKTCVWVPKVLVSDIKGPETVWVPKNKA
jgi:hypothetical protein